MSMASQKWFGGSAHIVGVAAVSMNTSARVWAIDPTIAATVTLPDATTIPDSQLGGPMFYVFNLSGNTMDINRFFLNDTIATVPVGGMAIVSLQSGFISAGVWHIGLRTTIGEAANPELADLMLFPGGTNSQAQMSDFSSVTNTWTTRTANPLNGHQEGQGFVIGQYAFLWGSDDPADNGGERYDSVGDSYTASLVTLPATGTRTHATAGGAVSGLGYVIGGVESATNGSRTDEYDPPPTDTFTATGDLMPANRAYAAGAVAFGGVYVIAGSYDDTFFNGEWSIFLYSPGVGWNSNLNEMPYPRRCDHDAATADDSGDKIFVFGGNRYDGTADFSLTDCDRYDPVVDEWLSRTDFPGVARLGLGATTGGEVIHVAGGRTQLSTGDQSDHYAYHPTLDTWATETDFTAATGYWDNQCMTV